MFAQAPSSPAARAVERFLASPLSIVVALLVAFLLSTASLPLTDVDEGAFTEATREMLERGNLVSPTLNGAPRHDKPILIYWAQAASVSLFGQSEFTFRLPSLLASLFWLFALYRFARRHGDAATAQAATLVMSLTLIVGVVARAAIADALLNLFIALAMFGIYDYFVEQRRGSATGAIRRRLLGVYAVLGLGFLTKGPVAVFFPLLVSALFFVSAGAWRAWLRAVFFWPGWLLFLAIVVPWHVLVWLDQGDAFFRGFYLKHNLDRYSNTFEGHGGNPFYYLLVAPLILLPFTGWLLAIAGRVVAAARARSPGLVEGDGLFERFLLIWFVVVFVFFSFSGTQLPHYLVYGCTPLFLLLARHRLAERRWLAFLPPILFALLLGALPVLLGIAAERSKRPLESLLLADLQTAFNGDLARAASAGLLVVLLGLAFWRRLPAWQGLVLAGLVQGGVLFGVVAPAIVGATQGPVRAAAAFAAAQPAPVVAWRIYQPSFSVYRRAVTPYRLPQAGELVLTRSDRLGEVVAAVAPLVVTPVFQQSYVTLARVAPAQP